MLAFTACDLSKIGINRIEPFYMLHWKSLRSKTFVCLLNRLKYEFVRIVVIVSLASGTKQAMTFIFTCNN